MRGTTAKSRDERQVSPSALSLLLRHLNTRASLSSASILSLRMLSDRMLVQWMGGECGRPFRPFRPTFVRSTPATVPAAARSPDCNQSQADGAGREER